MEPLIRRTSSLVAVCTGRPPSARRPVDPLLIATAVAAVVLPIVVAAVPVVLMFVVPVIEPPELPVMSPVTASEPAMSVLPAGLMLKTLLPAATFASKRFALCPVKPFTI